ncbi:MAG: CocE/NonD family hydrolase [Steroidobacteraceae bacterium]
MNITASYTVTRNVLLPMRDGIRLSADLWLPDTREPVPAILFRTPYDRSAYNPDVLRPQQCVEAGFAAVVQDMRGRFGSEGEWQPLNWAQEGADSYDTIEWIAAQSWCSASVGMSGLSYCGTTQLAASLTRPPHLKAIAPTMASCPEFDRIEAGGALRLDLGISWLVVTAIDWLLRRRAAGHALPEAEALILRAVQDPRFLYEVRPLREMPLFSIAGFPISFDELYTKLSVPTDVSGIDLDIPTLHIGGWYDFSHSTAVNLFMRQAAAANSHSHLVMGPWTHSSQLPQIQGQVNFGAMASGAASRLHEVVLNFFRRHLKQDTVQLPRVRYFLMNSGGWREDSEWPPKASTVRRMYLGMESGVGALTDSMTDEDRASDDYRYDPRDPTPTVGGRNLGLGRLSMGPVAQPLGHLSDMLRYTSPTLSDTLDIAGSVTATLWISSSAVDTDFIVKLIDVDVNEIALPVCEGALRLRYRSGFDHEAPYEPGAVESIEISLGHVAWRVLQGHRLRVQIQSANFPHLDANSNLADRLGAGVAVATATNKVFRDRTRASFIEFGVLG